MTAARQDKEQTPGGLTRIRKKNSWPNVYSRVHRSGSKSWVVDLGEINGKRERHSFKSKDEAETFAEQARIKRHNEGLAAFNLPAEVRTDAMRASELLKPLGVSIHEAALEFTKARQAIYSPALSLPQITQEYSKVQSLLAPHGVSLIEAVQHYQRHVLRFKDAPAISSIVQRMLRDAESNKRRDRTVGDLRHRLTGFAVDFGERRLSELAVQEIKEWVADEDWAARTRINYLTKISQLFNYGIKHGWAEVNIATQIDRPEVEDDEPEVFSVDEVKALLEISLELGLRAYIAIALFAGLRSAELLRLKGDAIKTEEKVIVVGADVAKKRSRRVVEMHDALTAWLKAATPLTGQIVDPTTFREKMELLKEGCGMKRWPHNGLRHSFGSYHLALYGDQVKTAAQMGHRDSDVIHNHYKALILKSQAEKFWALRPK